MHGSMTGQDFLLSEWVCMCETMKELVLP